MIIKSIMVLLVSVHLSLPVYVVLLVVRDLKYPSSHLPFFGYSWLRNIERVIHRTILHLFGRSRCVDRACADSPQGCMAITTRRYFSMLALVGELNAGKLYVF